MKKMLAILLTVMSVGIAAPAPLRSARGTVNSPPVDGSGGKFCAGCDGAAWLGPNRVGREDGSRAAAH